MPSTHRSDSIRLDLPLGGRPRYGDDFARSRTAPTPVSRETLSLPPTGTNPRSADFHPKRHFFAVISVVRKPPDRRRSPGRPSRSGLPGVAGHADQGKKPPVRVGASQA